MGSPGPNGNRWRLRGQRPRRETGPSRYRLAKMAGIPEKSVRDYEGKGIENARYGAIRRVALALGVSMEDLYDGSDGHEGR